MAVRRFGFWKEVQDLRLYRNPDPSKGRWMRLVLPADYVNKKLCGWNQKHAKDQSANQFGCSPWGNSDFGEGDYLLYGVGFPSVSLGELKLHPLNNYSIEGNALVDSYVKGSLCNWSHDKQNQKYSYEFYLDNDQEETNPIVLYDDDEVFWQPYQSGSGSWGVTLLKDTANKVKGASCLKMVIGSGSYASVGCRHEFSPTQDWSGYDFLCLYIYGANTGATINVVLGAPYLSDQFYWLIVDNFTGFRRFILPLRKASKAGNPNLSTIGSINIYEYPTAANTKYIDRTVVDVGRWVAFEARVPDSVKRVDLYSWDGSQYQKCLNGGLASTDKLFFLDGSKLSEIIPYGGGLGEVYTGSRGEAKVVDNALSFDGVDDYVEVPNASSLNPDYITIVVWVKNHDLAQSKNVVSKGVIGVPPNRSYELDFNAGYYRFRASVNGVDDVTVSAPVSDTLWHQIVGVFDGVNIKIYVDSILISNASLTGVLYKNSFPLKVAAGAYSPWDFFKGIVGELRVYNRALSQSEIQQLYNRRFDAPIQDITNGLVLWHKYDGDAQDYSGNGNHGTIYGAKFLVPTDQHQYTYSPLYGCRKRVAFLIKMPPEDFRDSATYGISQCRLKLECFYSDDGKATYEFEDSDNQFYGLRNISKKYIMLFRKDAGGPTDFIQLKNATAGDGLPTYLSVTADHNQEIHEVKLALPNLLDSSKKHWGQSTKDPTLDQDGDGILDAVEEVEEFIDGGGWG